MACQAQTLLLLPGWLHGSSVSSRRPTGHVMAKQTQSPAAMHQGISGEWEVISSLSSLHAPYHAQVKPSINCMPFVLAIKSGHCSTQQ